MRIPIRGVVYTDDPPPITVYSVWLQTRSLLSEDAPAERVLIRDLSDMMVKPIAQLTPRLMQNKFRDLISMHGRRHARRVVTLLRRVLDCAARHRDLSPQIRLSAIVCRDEIDRQLGYFLVE